MSMRILNRVLPSGAILSLLVISTLIGAPASQPALRPASQPSPFKPRANDPNLPTVFIVGDSTVKNHWPLVGWGDPIADYFDLKRINVENDAAAGRSSRTFIAEGRWEAVRAKLRPGDFVLMQFGHNDTKAPISAQRYSMPGLGDETEKSVDAKTGEAVTIHTYGWYMRKMISEAQAAGATPIVFSSVPRCKWADGKIVRGEENHVLWASQIAAKMGVQFVDLNALIADLYDPCGQRRIKALYFPGDNTHVNLAGAKVNAACAVMGIWGLKDCALGKFLVPNAAEMAAEGTVIPPMPVTRPATTESSATHG
jgi:rhamnogalacturonan acetylesterase